MLKREKVCNIEALHVYALGSKSLQVRYKIELFTGYWMGIEFKASVYGRDQRHIWPFHSLFSRNHISHRMGY